MCGAGSNASKLDLGLSNIVSPARSGVCLLDQKGPCLRTHKQLLDDADAPTTSSFVSRNSPSNDPVLVYVVPVPAVFISVRSCLNASGSRLIPASHGKPKTLVSEQNPCIPASTASVDEVRSTCSWLFTLLAGDGVAATHACKQETGALSCTTVNVQHSNDEQLLQDGTLQWTMNRWDGSTKRQHLFKSLTRRSTQH